MSLMMFVSLQGDGTVTAMPDDKRMDWDKFRLEKLSWFFGFGDKNIFNELANQQLVN